MRCVSTPTTLRLRLRGRAPWTADRSVSRARLRSALASLVGAAGETGWAGAVLAELVRAVGPQEPDLILLCGDDPVDPMLETIAEFFGASLLPTGRSAPAGLVAATPEGFVRDDSPPG